MPQHWLCKRCTLAAQTLKHMLWTASTPQPCCLHADLQRCFGCLADLTGWKSLSMPSSLRSSQMTFLCVIKAEVCPQFLLYYFYLFLYLLLYYFTCLAGSESKGMHRLHCRLLNHHEVWAVKITNSLFSQDNTALQTPLLFRSLKSYH